MKISNIKYSLYVLLLSAAATGCRPDGKDYTLQPMPQLDFEFVPGANANSYILVNKSSAPTQPRWESTNGTSLAGDSARIRFVFPGTYEVTMKAAAQGGIGSVTKSITINQSDPTACDPANPLGFIASCTNKTWKLNPEAGAYKVGPGANNGSWWTSGPGEPAARPCEFNDEYTFSFNQAGDFVYDNKGDVFGDGYLGNGNGCQPNSALSAAHAPWASGNFKFTVSETGGINGLGQLTVIGVGAHIGLQKVHNGGESTSGPVGDRIVYDILSMERNVGGQGYDLLTLGVHIGGDGWWTFTLRSF